MIQCRFLGRACIEIISENDHIIIDPNYVKPPRKGINKILLTHEHDDHLSQEDIQKIYKEYIREDQDCMIYGPLSVKDKIGITEPIIVEDGTIIDLNEGDIRVFSMDCWGADSCVAYLIAIEDKYILHTADSANYSERLKKITEPVDCSFVACFEDYYEDYLDFIQRINPRLTIPYHFDPEKEEMGKNLADYLDKQGINVRFLHSGEEIEI
jgi:L-ascorbate metabolism protein UlaG (beta-lactamase superfamily)